MINILSHKWDLWDFSGGPAVKTLPANEGGKCSIPSQGATLGPCGFSRAAAGF